jgi:hypothetical protein
VGHGSGLAGESARKGRTERDARCLLPDCRGAQQKHNATDATLEVLAPEPSDVVRAWDRVPETLRAAIMAIIRSVG